MTKIRLKTIPYWTAHTYIYIPYKEVNPPGKMAYIAVDRSIHPSGGSTPFPTYKSTVFLY